LQTKFQFFISAGGIASLGKKKGKLSKLGPMMEKKIIPVETDPQKLVNYVCGSNLLKEGEDIKLKPDDEYPDWLWTLRTGEM
jgi:large subunit ribosomal protein L54